MRFWLYLPLTILSWLLAYPLVPVAVALADDQGRLPRPLRWLETHDALGWVGPMTEPATIRTTERFGRKAGLIHYLWRNKAYTLRYWMRARIDDGMVRAVSGDPIPARWGLSVWRAQIGPYFEVQPRIGLGRVHLYLRIGWKLKPFFDSAGPHGLSAGIFTGISVRSDDWDDYPVASWADHPDASRLHTPERQGLDGAPTVNAEAPPT